jgi:hypothetical protein
VNLGPLILLALVVGEIVSLVKLGKQGKRIAKLEEDAGRKKEF